MAYVEVVDKTVTVEGREFRLFDEENLETWANEEIDEEARANWSQFAVEVVDVSIPMKFDIEGEKAKLILKKQNLVAGPQYGYVVETKDDVVVGIYVVCGDLGWGETLDINDLCSEEIEYVKTIIKYYQESLI